MSKGKQFILNGNKYISKPYIGKRQNLGTKLYLSTRAFFIQMKIKEILCLSVCLICLKEKIYEKVELIK